MSAAHWRAFARVWLAVVVVLMLAVSSAGLASADPEETTAPPASTEPPDLGSVPQEPEPLSEQEAMAKAESTDQPVEVSELTTPTRRVVADPESNGFVAELSPIPVRMLDGDQWVDIDTSFERAADGTGEVTASPVDVEAGRGSEPFASLEADGASIDLRWRSALPSPTLRGDVAVWPNVAPGVDLAVQSGATGMRTFVVVRTREAAADPLLQDLRFGYSAPGLSVAGRDGGFVAKNVAGKEVLTGSPLRMWESPVAGVTEPADVTVAAVTSAAADSRSVPVGLSVTGSEFKLDPDDGFLADPTTRFPVVIDPEYTHTEERELWAMVWDNGLEFWNSSTEHARVGYDGWSDNKKSRAFYQFDMNLYDGATINSALFAHKQIHSAPNACGGTVSPGVEIWRTGTVSSSVSWSNQPSWSDELTTATTSHGNSANCSGYSRTEWSAKDAVQDAADAGWDSLTLGLKSANESDKMGWRQFDNDGTFPSLTIKYNRTPTVPGIVSSSSWLAYGGQFYTADATPALSVKVSDPDGGSVRARFIINEKDVDDVTPMFYSSYVTSGGTAAGTVPSSYMVNGKSYWVYARANDGSLESVSGPTQLVTIDSTKPVAPTVTATVPPGAQLGDTIIVTIDSSSSDAVRYRYGVNTDVAGTAAPSPSSPGAAVQVPVVLQHFGPNWIVATAEDRAGNVSNALPDGQLQFQFNVAGVTASHTYRIDKNGTDDNHASVDTKPLVIPSPAPNWSQGRDYYNPAEPPPNNYRDCTDWAFATSASATVKTLTTATDPLDSSRPFSITAWVKPAAGFPTKDTGSGFEAMFASIYTDGGTNAQVQLGYRKATSTGVPTWILMFDENDTPGDRWFIDSGIEVTTAWTNVAVVWNPKVDHTAQIWINGQLGLSRTDVGTPLNGNRLMVGGALTGGSGVVGWSGVIDEVRIYPGVLSGSQIDQYRSANRDFNSSTCPV